MSTSSGRTLGPRPLPFRWKVSRLGASLLGMLLLTGCSTDDHPWIGRPHPPEVAVLRLATGGDPAGLDPTRYHTQTSWRVARLLFEGLTAFEADGTVRPAVAAGWSSDSTATTFTFRLRPQVHWSDGEPLTAHDFVFAWQRVLDPALGAESAAVLYPIAGALAVNQGHAPLSALGVEALANDLLEVRLAGPDPDFPVRAALPPLFPVPRHQVIDRRLDWPADRTPVGNGPFTLTRWQPNDRLEAARSTTYWDRDRITLEGVVLYPLSDEETIYALYRTNRLDWTTTGTLGPSRARPLIKRGSPEIHIQSVWATYYLEFNTRRPPLDDPRVRRALEASIPRRRMAESIFGTGQHPTRRFVSENLPGWSPPPEPPEGLEQARALLADAGYPEGRGLPPLIYLYSPLAIHAAVAEYLQGVWGRELGVRLVLEPMEWTAAQARAERGDFHLLRSGWLADLPLAESFLEVFRGGNPNNLTGWHDPAYDALLDQAARTPRPDRRRELLRGAEHLLLEAGVIAPIVQNAGVQLIKPYVRGLKPNPLQVVDWTRVRIDREWSPR